MDYPISMQSVDGKDFTIAVSESEHIRLSGLGFLPAYEHIESEPAKRRGRPPKQEE
jgi:hypothetical protein